MKTLPFNRVCFFCCMPPVETAIYSENSDTWCDELLIFILCLVDQYAEKDFRFRLLPPSSVRPFGKRVCNVLEETAVRVTFVTPKPPAAQFLKHLLSFCLYFLEGITL